VDEANWKELAFAYNDSTADSTWLDHTLASAVPNADLCGFNFEELFSIQEEDSSIFSTDDWLRNEPEECQLHCRPPEFKVNRHAIQGVPITREVFGSKFNLNLPEFGVVSAPEKFPRPLQPAIPSGTEQSDVIAKDIIGNCKDRISPSGFPPSGPESASSETEHHHSKFTAGPIAKVNCGFLREELESEFTPFIGISSHTVATVHNEHRDAMIKAESISSFGESSCRSHALNSRSIRRRLTLKYSGSLVDDVISILQHLTVSGSSALSSRRAGKRLSKASTSSSGQKIDPELSPSLPDPDFISPSTAPSTDFLGGASPGYCWERISPNTLRRSNTTLHPEALTGRPSGPDLSATIRTNVLSFIVNNINRIGDFSERDAFGNLVLHVAAALSNFGELESLVNLGADINSVNSAGQTFLHLAAKSYTRGYMGVGSLLRIAREHGFDFHKLDHLGQNTIHILTRPWISPHILDMVIATLYDLGIDPTASRDYLGWTVVEQLNHFSSRDLEYDSVREAAILSLTCEKEGHIANQTRLIEHFNRIESTQYHDLSSHNFKSPAMIETLADLEMYTYHTELLKTVNKAMLLPWFEDSRGRNGLHCLAEVSLNLPGHIPPSPDDDSPADRRPPREKYLDGLLNAGVDINNYDKRGNTPLMAFITRTRVDEDAELTTRLLRKLLKAGANLHWRNRQGKTALHIAIKLGRRAATALLLQQKANMHARTGNGKGVLVLGQEACRGARDDVNLYAQIELCMSFAIDAGAVSTPTVLQEWKCS
jgi:hypothetical protein